MRHAVATSSGTGALFLSYLACGLRPGDEVIIPTYGFVATYTAAIFAGLVPVPAEIDDSLTLDPEDVERRITPRTKAIVPVHMLGNPAEMAAIGHIAQQHGLIVIEDACQAAGAIYHGRKVGSFGVAAAFSLNIFKTITAGDGGILVTDDAALRQRAFALHDQGYRPAGGATTIAADTILGMNFRMNELTGAVARAQLRKLDRITATLRAKKERLKAAHRPLAGLPVPAADGRPRASAARSAPSIFDRAARGRRGGRRLGHHHRRPERLARAGQHGPREPPFAQRRHPLRPRGLSADRRPPGPFDQPQRGRDRRGLGRGLRHRHQRRRGPDRGGARRSSAPPAGRLAEQEGESALRRRRRKKGLGIGQNRKSEVGSRKGARHSEFRLPNSEFSSALYLVNDGLAGSLPRRRKGVDWPPGGHMADAAECKTRRRWLRLTPDRCVLGLLALEALLLLSEWFQWFPFNQHKGWTVLIAIATVGAALVLMFLWFLAALLFRLRFQFSILSLLVLMLAVAVPFSWLTVEREQARKQRAAVDWIEKAGGFVLYDYEFDPSGNPIPAAKPPGPSWLRKPLGDDYFADVTVVDLHGQEVSDAGLEHLKGLAQLQRSSSAAPKSATSGWNTSRR